MDWYGKDWNGEEHHFKKLTDFWVCNYNFIIAKDLDHWSGRYALFTGFYRANASCIFCMINSSDDYEFLGKEISRLFLEVAKEYVIKDLTKRYESGTITMEQIKRLS